MKLKAVREEGEGVNRGRRDAQEAVRGELQGLEEAWRGGVDRALRAKVEGERVRGEILELRRRQGS